MNVLHMTVCPSCGSTEIEKVCRDWSGSFEGQTYTVPALEFYECPACGEKVYDREAMRKIQEYSPAFTRAHTQ